MVNSAFQLINNLIDLCETNYQGLVNFYNMNWYGLEIGHYMSWLGLGGISIVALQAYLDTNKNKNDIRRFQIDEQHRK